MDLPAADVPLWHADHLCRACYKQLNTATAVEANTCVNMLEMPGLMDKLSACISNIFITANRGSKYLCWVCFHRVNEFYEFREMCLQSIRRFEEIQFSNETEYIITFKEESEGANDILLSTDKPVIKEEILEESLEKDSSEMNSVQKLTQKETESGRIFNTISSNDNIHSKMQSNTANKRSNKEKVVQMSVDERETVVASVKNEPISNESEGELSFDETTSSSNVHNDFQEDVSGGDQHGIRNKYQMTHHWKSSTMLLKIKYNDVVNFFKIPNPESGEFSPNKVIASIVKQFNINTKCGITFKDRDGAEICVDDFKEILCQYKGCGSFLLEISESSSNEKPLVVSSLSSILLENYLKSGDFAPIFEEYKKTNTLSDCSRRSLVRECTNFLRQQCGTHPRREEKIALAEAIIHLFPTYKISNSKFGGIDLFYNPENNSGYIVNKLKNINHRLMKFESGGNKKRKISNVEQESADSAIISEQDLRFFQNCIVPDELNLVQEKLRETLKARQKFIATENLTASKVLEHFPIFSYDSSLIGFDFSLRYGEAISNSLLDNFAKYESCAESIFIEASGGSNLGNYTDWPSEVLPFLIFLKLLPSTANGRDQKRTTFQKSIDCFISFENVNTPITDNIVASSQPTIVAVGLDKATICQYFITICGKKIAVPSHFKFRQVFDLYFKAFYVFNIPFDITLANFLGFFAKFIYKIDNKKKPSSRLLEVHSKFENKFKQATYTATKTTPNAAMDRVKKKINSIQKHEGLKHWHCTHEGCDKSYWRQEYLKIHQSTHTDPNGLKRFYCTHEGCDKSYAWPNYLKIHQSRHENSNSEHDLKRFHCTHERCEKSYACPADLKKHQRRHNTQNSEHNLKPYRCSHEGCNKSFPWPSNLRKHESRHANLNVKCVPKLFHCLHEGCDESYAWAKDFKKHQMWHENSNIKRFYCTHEGCDKSFSWLKGLKRHQNRHNN